MAYGFIGFKKSHSTKPTAPAPKQVTIPNGNGNIVLRDMDTPTASGKRDGIYVHIVNGAGIVKFGDAFLQAQNAARGVENPMATELKYRRQQPFFVKGLFRNSPVPVTEMKDDKGHPIYMVKEADAPAMIEYLRKRAQTVMRLGYGYVIA